jgi:hypothetical protein
MAKWRHAVPYEHIHIFFVPCLMANRWRKFLGKASDYLFEIPLTFIDVWNENMFEPLVFAVSFPIFTKKTYQIKFREDIVKNFDSQLRRLQKSPNEFRTFTAQISHPGGGSFRHVGLHGVRNFTSHQRFCRSPWEDTTMRRD